MKRPCFLLLALAACAIAAPASAGDVIAPSIERFAQDTDEVPDIRRHVIPMLGRVGCNGRACHGSFQGQGGFRLSLFGYDFDADRKAMLEGDEARINLEMPDESLVLQKPTMQIDHEGGELLEVGAWQYRLLLGWIEAGAPAWEKTAPTFSGLEITPSEIQFQSKGEKVQLKVVARWSDGTREDVTCLSRFKTNSSQVAAIDENGLVTANEPGDTHLVVFYDNGVQPVPVIRPVSDRVGPKYPKIPTPTKIDRLVVQKLRKLGVVPSELATDSEFLRRVSLDITGTLPATKEIEAFLADASADKRSKKIDALLERPGYAAWWTTRLCDITGNNADNLNNVTPVRSAASQEWYDWIHKRVADNTPYDELVEGIVLATSRNGDEDFRQYSQAMSKLYSGNSDTKYEDRESMPHYWARRNFRRPEERVIGFAYAFMGVRMQCAQCHKHPFDQWTKQDFEDFRGFFTRTTFGTNPEVREEYAAMTKELGLEGKRGGELRRELPRLLQEGKTIPFQEVYAVKPRPPRNTSNNPKAKRRRGGNQAAASATLLGGEKIDLTQHQDARSPLMKWLRSKDNPYFARAFVNRVWAAYFNVGIVEPPDDLSLANPPSNRPLLDYLADGFIESGFDMKWLHREIAGSRTYQLSWKTNETNRRDEINFSHAVPRRMPAEVAYDALVQATASDDEAERLISDVSDRAISIPGAGRRNQRGGASYALTIFGRSLRESNCDCDRSMEASLLQTVYLQNDQEVFSLIDRRGEGWLSQVATEIGVSQPAQTARPGGATRRPANFKQQAARVRAQIKQAVKAGNDEQVRRLKIRLAAYLQRAGAAPARRKPEGNDASPGEKKPMDATELVRRAYLRTLSRHPNEEELTRSRQYIEESDDTLNGVRGLLWALINTKEFIINH